MDRTVGMRVAAVVVGLGWAFGAPAQITSTQVVPPSAKVVTPGGVDMRTGDFAIETPDLSIGSGDGGGISFLRVPQRFKPFTSNW
jgi:hypothetical protein